MKVCRHPISLLLLASIACDTRLSSRHPGGADATRRIANLHAFARVYGLVRWFHPSDAATAVDWDSFAIEGVHRVADASNDRDLQHRLTKLLAPIAPSVRIVGPGEMFPDQPILHPAPALDLDVVAWQHKGYGDTTLLTNYVSKRTHRDTAVRTHGAAFAALSQTIDAAPLRGSTVRLRGKLRTSKSGRGQLWLRVDKRDVAEFFDNMKDRPVRTDDWTSVEIVGAVSRDATRIAFGVLNVSQGAVWYDDLEFSVATANGEWTPLQIADATFEDSEIKGWQAGVGRSNTSPPVGAAVPPAIEGWRIFVDRGFSASGQGSLRIEPATEVLAEDLFVQVPAGGEVFDADLGNGLRVRVPIALYSRNGKTLDTANIRRDTEPLQHRGSEPGFDALAGAADVIVLWNVFQHFWPYWDAVSANWYTMLDSALAASLVNHDIDDRLLTLERFSTGAPDGHVSLHCPGESKRGYLPFAVDFVESTVVVTRSADRAVERGDVLESVDGHGVLELLDAEQGFVSGSPQWRRVRALRRLGRGSVGSSAHVQIRRGNRELGLTMQRVDKPITGEPLYPPIIRFSDGVYYVDLSRTEMAELDRIVDQLAVAPGLIFDLRRYPRPESLCTFKYTHPA